MSFELTEKLQYMFDGYALFFILSTNAWGLFKDIKQSKDKGTNRDAVMAKRIYITLIALIISLFIIVRII